MIRSVGFAARRRSRQIEATLAIAVLAVAISGFFAIPNLVSGWAFVMPGTTDGALQPTFFPRLAMVLLGLAAGNLLLTAWQRDDTVPLMRMDRQDWRRVGVSGGLIAAYLLALPKVGFLIASAAFIAATALTSGYRRYWIVALVAVAAPITIMLGFRYALRVLLPAGTWF